MTMNNRFVKTLMILGATVMISLGAAGSAEAASLQLGNNSENILNGGVLASDASGSVVYFANTGKGNKLYSRKGDSQTSLTGDAASNINVIGKNIYYTTDKNEGSVVYRYNVSNGQKTKCFTTAKKIKEMYVSDDKTFYYLSSGNVYTRVDGETESTLTAGKGDVLHFIPTEYGMILAKGSVRNYHIYADSVSIRSKVNSFYTVDGYLIFRSGSKDYQVRIRDMFNGFSSSDISAYTLGDGVQNVAALANALADADNCEECEQNAKAYARTGKAADDVDAVNASGTQSILNDSSVSNGQRNIVKRARQQHEIVWKPLANITGWGGQYQFAAGTTYTGLPYGQPVHAAYVPWDASLMEFLDAVADPASKMYTDISTYNRVAPYYSCDCSSFASWAWQLSARHTTSNIATKATLVKNQSIYSVEIGDIFNMSGSHVVVVSDIGYRDDTMVYVDIIEQTPPSTKLTRYGEGGSKTLDDLYTKYLAGGRYKLYRSKSRDTVTYTPSPAVSLGGDDKVETGKVTMQTAEATLNAGETVQLSYTATATGSVIWKSSSTAVAKVDKNGLVTAVAGGKARITVSVGGVEASAVVYVNPALTQLSSVKAINDGSVKITWKAVTNATNYQVFRKNAAGTWDLIATVKSGKTYSDTGLASNTYYEYTVRAVMTLDGKTFVGPYDEKGMGVRTVLAAPELKTVTNSDSQKQKVTWTAVDDAEGYNVYRKVSGGKWELLGNTAKTSYTSTKLAFGTKYIYTVRAYRTDNGKQVLGNYDRVGISKKYVMLTPELVSAKADANGKITLTWKNVNSATAYYVYRHDGNGAWKKISSVKGTSYVDANLPYNKTYTYTVRGWVTVNGKVLKSGYDAAGVSCKLQLKTPALKSANLIKNNSVEITWKTVTGAEQYRVYRKTTGKWKQIATVNGSSYIDTEAECGQVNTYTVRAVKQVSGKIYLSSYKKAGISCSGGLATPVLKSVKLTSNSKVKITWESVAGAEQYRVYRKTTGKWKQIATVKGSSYTDAKATCGQVNTYTIRALKQVNGEAYLSSYDKTGLSCRVDLATPKLKSASLTKKYNVKVSWSKVSGADGYRVYRREEGTAKWKKVKTLNKTSYTDSKVVYKKTYTYTVRAYKKVNGKTLLSGYDATGITCQVKLDTPEIETVVSEKAHTVIITWGAVKNAEGYRVYYKKPEGGWKKLANTDKNVTTLKKKKLSSGQTYLFTVRAFNEVNGKTRFSGYNESGVGVVVK